MSEKWTTTNIPDLTGKVIIVTGANSGIGYEAAKEFARKRARTILACHDMAKAQGALDQIQAEIPNAQVEIMQLDLASLTSVRQFAEAFRSRFDRLDVLLNNAGIMMSPYHTTKDGFEVQLGTNHLGHFALTGLLIDLLRKTPDSRIVSISSGGHRFGKMDFENLMYEGGRGYSPTRAYGRSKLANLLFTYELQRQFEASRVSTIAVAAHPGGSHTNLNRYIKGKWWARLMKPVMDRMMQSAAMGALPSIRAATDLDITGGQYFGPGGLMEQRGYPVVVQSNEASHNEADARRLWRISEQLTGVRYDLNNNISH
jgi:NAD(P)-dependent dehydrogenase (short-subunit alcohol dehydrogenase family)